MACCNTVYIGVAVKEYVSVEVANELVESNDVHKLVWNNENRRADVLEMHFLGQVLQNRSRGQHVVLLFFRCVCFELLYRRCCDNNELATYFSHDSMRHFKGPHELCGILLGFGKHISQRV